MVSFKPRVIGHVAPRVVKFGLQVFIRFIVTSNSLLHSASVCFYTSDACIYFQQAEPTRVMRHRILLGAIFRCVCEHDGTPVFSPTADAYWLTLLRNRDIDLSRPKKIRSIHVLYCKKIKICQIRFNQIHVCHYVQTDRHIGSNRPI